MCLKLRNRTQVQLDRLDGLGSVFHWDAKCSVLLNLKWLESSVETMQIKALIVSKSTYDYLFLNWMALINFATKIFKVATKFS